MEILEDLKSKFKEGQCFKSTESGYHWSKLNKLVNEGHLNKTKISNKNYYYFGVLNNNIDNNQINHNDKIYSLEEIEHCLTWQEYHRSLFFKHLGKLTKDIDKEKLNLILDDGAVDQKGVVYAFVVNNHIFKIGKTDNTMADRVQSYNCGKQKNRDKGTCSTTNYMVLQTFLNLPVDVDVYIYKVPSATLNVFGESVAINVSPSKYVEKKLNEDLISQSNGIKPVGLVQL